MPWKEITAMSQRTEMVKRAKTEGANISAICREVGISRKTAYKWLKREHERGAGGLQDRSRRPQSSPNRTEPEMEELVVAVRQEHKVWGGRKIRKVLETAGYEHLPSASTITAILKRHQQIDPNEGKKHTAWQRFERECPNELWQMDFKGYFALVGEGYCHPLTVIDDHSRFLVGLQACMNQKYLTVQVHLTEIFRQFGLPEYMLMDNGSPWGDERKTPYTILTAWLFRLGIQITHGRPYHPQTQGKDERLNRTLNEEVIKQHSLFDLAECQAVFDDWQYTYNYIRPHEALDMFPPATRYSPSSRAFPEVLPPVTYETNDIIRKVDQSGKISFENLTFRIGKAFRHHPVAIRSADVDGDFQVFFCKQLVAKISLRKDNS